MKNILLIPVLCLFITCPVLGQYYLNQNKVWAFGDSAGVNFASGAPTAIKTSINTFEGCASVSDTSGSLLFYTDGKTVYDRNGTVMPSSSSIVSFTTSSTMQASVITPVIGTKNKYYIFSKENLESTSTSKCHLTYSVVDMNMAGGFGDVVTTSMGIPLGDSLGEGMTAIPGNKNNIWLVTHKKDTSLFLAYEISSKGIAQPVISAAGNFLGSGCYQIGMIKASPDRRRLVLPAYVNHGLEIYDFDPNSGKISNCKLLNTNGGQISAEFSPDNTRLYVITNVDGISKKITQYNITLSDPSAINSSGIAIMTTLNFNGYDLRLAPDGKIYLMGATNSSLDCIAKPNLLGTSCNYIANAVTLLAGTFAKGGLPNLYVTTDSVNKTNINQTTTSHSITLYPNPAYSECTISYSSTLYNKASIAIYDITGRLLLTQPLTGTNTTISIASLPPGIYHCRIDADGSGIVTKKLVVMR